jgi:hypothetical protein
MNRNTTQMDMCKGADKVNKILDKLSLKSSVYAINDNLGATA